MRKHWLVFSQIVAAVVLVLAAVAGLGWLFPGLMPNGTKISIREIAQTGQAQRAAGTYAEAAKRALPSVVNIFTSKEVRLPRSPFMDDPMFQRFFGFRPESQAQRVTNLGSGVIVSDQGYILTNQHVVEAADEIQVTLADGRSLPAKVVGTDPETDLAVLKVQQAGLPAITFAKPDSLQVGDVVLAIGNPFGVGQAVTMGIVSALGRSHLGINTFESFIQTDAAINPGNSGGALIDISGNLVGINSAIYSRSGGNMGIGFAIPVSIARQIMEQIITTGGVTRGWIGIEVQDITPEVAESFALPSTQGALIAGVLRGGPADRAGIRPGDVLVKVNGKAVTDSTTLLGLIAALSPGQTANLEIQRRQQPLQLRVQAEKRPLMRRQAQE
ncbi:serine protease DegQ [Sulfuritortus calidifontis]|uniref:Serine protease DegQ n=1 Tax=Sulfuritortus calidifontis TaxID=1914471 RepID=A0A4R3JUT1_9PROT|nr:Do family serine endopeptidase [Sulfuritortus calidifontis]TCS71664.1 serine protease DegQ [Sulfuritortus calidifontis]